ncbi:hypothetical protein BDV93DRAFT_544276 [Ceratobasidium sp. AG-I]|nr:hypothetical protein BDV93DRAFT_544276 [Ceratobasidium sp. AG-I]
MLQILPPEVIVIILEKCHYGDILHASETCRKLFDSVSNSVKLQLCIELEAGDFELSNNIKRSGRSPNELLAKLRGIRDKWIHLNVSNPHYLEFPRSINTLANYAPRLGYIPSRINSRVAPVDFRGFDLATHQARIIAIEEPFVQSSVDVSQDLLVLITIRYSSRAIRAFNIHLRTYTDGGLHPLAQLSTWTVHLPFNPDFLQDAINIEVFNDLLAVRFSPIDRSLSDILIWNWRSGVLLNRVTIKRARDFGFLSSNCLSVLRPTSTPERGRSIGLFIFNNIRERSTSAPTSTNGVYFAARYAALPPSVELCFPSHMTLLSDITQHPTLSQRKRHSSGSLGFRPNLDPSILHLTMIFRVDGGESWNSPSDAIYDIFISKAKLLKYVVPPASPVGHLRRVLWEEWGENTTRWFNSTCFAGAERERWMMEGTRAIATIYPKQANGMFEYVTLLDFHPFTVRRSSNTSNECFSMCNDDTNRHDDLESSTKDLADVLEVLGSSENEVFVDVVGEDVPTIMKDFTGGAIVSKLPYRVVARRMQRERWSKWILDEHRIVEVPLDRREDMPGQKLCLKTYIIE